MFTLKFFVSGFSYPPKEGLHANMANTLNVFGEHLQKRGGEILFFAFCKRKKDVDLDQIQAKHSNLHIKFAFKAMPLRYPTLLLVFTLLPRFVCRRFIGLGKASPSLIFIDGIPLSPLLKAKTEIPTIMSAVDAWSLRQHRLAKQSSGFKKLFLKSLSKFQLWVEKRYFVMADVVHVVSSSDAAYYRKMLPGCNVVSIPVAIETHVDIPAVPINLIGETRYLLFWGDLRLPQIRKGLFKFLRDVWPKICSQCAGLEFHVLGRDSDNPEWDVFKQQRVVFRDWVKDVGKYLQGSVAVVLLDQTGTGLKNRTINALYSGRPIVATRSAWQGIPVKNGIHGFVANQMADFQIIVSELLNKPEVCNEVGENGRKLALANYHPDVVKKKWQELIDLLLDKKQL